MKKMYLFFWLLIASNLQISVLSAQNTTIFSIDKGKSLVKWQASKVTGTHNGVISISNGEATFSGKDLVSGKVFIDMTSIRNLDIKDAEEKKKLENHLKSEDFFNAKAYNESIFKIYKVNKIDKAEGYTHTIEGSLSIKGYTNKLIFPVKVEWKGDRAIISGSVTVDRTNYDIRYGSGKFFDELGDNLIYDDFIIEFEIQASLKDK